MQIGLMADVHYHPFTRYAKIDAGGNNSWIGQTLSLLEQAYQEFKRRGITWVVYLGDMFEVGHRSETDYFNQIHEFHRQKANQGFRITAIVGNHDQTYPGSPVSILAAMKDCMEVVNEYDWKALTNNVVVHFMPYREDPEEINRSFQDGLAANPAGLRHIVLGHLAVWGAAQGRGEYVPHHQVMATIFAQADLVLLGHYHKRQSLTPMVHYIGSLCSLDFGDAGDRDKRGLAILDTHDLSVEYVNLPSIGFEVMTAEDAMACVSGHQAEDQGVPVVQNCIVRVDYEAPVDEDTIRQGLLAAGARHVVFSGTQSKAQRVRVDSGQPGEEDGPGVEKYIKTYVQSFGGLLDAKRLISTGMALMGSEA